MMEEQRILPFFSTVAGRDTGLFEHAVRHIGRVPSVSRGSEPYPTPETSGDVRVVPIKSDPLVNSFDIDAVFGPMSLTDAGRALKGKLCVSLGAKCNPGTRKRRAIVHTSSGFVRVDRLTMLSLGSLELPGYRMACFLVLGRIYREENEVDAALERELRREMNFLFSQFQDRLRHHTSTVASSMCQRSFEVDNVERVRFEVTSDLYSIFFGILEASEFLKDREAFVYIERMGTKFALNSGNMVELLCTLSESLNMAHARNVMVDVCRSIVVDEKNRYVGLPAVFLRNSGLESAKNFPMFFCNNLRDVNEHFFEVVPSGVRIGFPFPKVNFYNTFSYDLIENEMRALGFPSITAKTVIAKLNPDNKSLREVAASKIRLVDNVMSKLDAFGGEVDTTFRTEVNLPVTALCDGFVYLMDLFSSGMVATVEYRTVREVTMDAFCLFREMLVDLNDLDLEKVARLAICEVVLREKLVRGGSDTHIVDKRIARGVSERFYREYTVSGIRDLVNDLTLSILEDEIALSKLLKKVLNVHGNEMQVGLYQEIVNSYFVRNHEVFGDIFINEFVSNVSSLYGEQVNLRMSEYEVQVRPARYFLEILFGESGFEYVRKFPCHIMMRNWLKRYSMDSVVFCDLLERRCSSLGITSMVEVVQRSPHNYMRFDSAKYVGFFYGQEERISKSDLISSVLCEMEKFKAPKNLWNDPKILGRTKHGMGRYRYSNGVESHRIVKDVRYGLLGLRTKNNLQDRMRALAKRPNPVLERKMDEICNVFNPENVSIQNLIQWYAEYGYQLTPGTIRDLHVLLNIENNIPSTNCCLEPPSHCHRTE